jgi:Fic family protein
VTDVIEGRRVLGPEDDIIAVKNAFEVYKTLDELNPFSICDLTNAHGVMMKGLVEEAGQIRTSPVGVINQNGNVIHVAPPVNMVNGLVNQLFDWLNESKAQMLIKSSVFHYEFEFIHPFRDGNGRMGRLWQTLILSKWKPIFEWIPIESIIKDNQEEYYKAIERSNKSSSSTCFIEFMLSCINEAIKDIALNLRKHYRHISKQINDLMNVIEDYPLSAIELMEKLNLKSRNAFRDNYLKPALEAGLIAMTIPDKPNSKNQRYYKI